MSSKKFANSITENTPLKTVFPDESRNYSSNNCEEIKEKPLSNLRYLMLILLSFLGAAVYFCYY